MMKSMTCEKTSDTFRAIHQCDPDISFNRADKNPRGEIAAWSSFTPISSLEKNKNSDHVGYNGPPVTKRPSVARHNNGHTRQIMESIRSLVTYRLACVTYCFRQRVISSLSRTAVRSYG